MFRRTTGDVTKKRKTSNARLSKMALSIHLQPSVSRCSLWADQILKKMFVLISFHLTTYSSNLYIIELQQTEVHLPVDELRKRSVFGRPEPRVEVAGDRSPWTEERLPEVLVVRIHTADEPQSFTKPSIGSPVRKRVHTYRQPCRSRKWRKTSCLAS